MDSVIDFFQEDLDVDIFMEIFLIIGVNGNRG